MDYFKGKKNADLWKRFLQIYPKQQIQFQWVKGHAGHPQNEKCDQLAVSAAESTTLSVVTEEVKTEEAKKEDDSKLEEYSKGVQSRIAKLTRKMREAERREAAALQYADSLEKKRKLDASKFAQVNSEYTTKL